MISNTAALKEMNSEAASMATHLARLLINREPISPQDLENAHELCRQAVGSPHERYVLALTIAVIHEARDHFAGLPEANARLIALAGGSLPSVAMDRDDIGPTAWQLIYRNGHTLAVLHHGAAKQTIVESASLLIDAVAQLPQNKDDKLASLSLLALTTALFASNGADEYRLALDIDTLAEGTITCLPGNSLAAAHWWVERTLIESFDASNRRANEQRVAELLALSSDAATVSSDPVVAFKHARNLFEFARRKQDLSSQRDSLKAMQLAYKKMGSRRRALGMRLLRMQALYALNERDGTAAQQHAHAAISLAQTLAAQPNDLMVMWNVLGLILYATTDRYGEAATAMRTAATHAVAQHRVLLEAAGDLLECRHLWRADQASALTKLRLGLSAAREIHVTALLTMKPALAAWIVARGIEHRIETEFCLQVIKQRQLLPPADAPREWPWKLRIQLLGGYSLEHDAESAAIGKTSEQRPHEVIQALAIAGPTGLTRAGLAKALYGLNPPRDSTATNMALSRARKLVGDPAVIESDGQRTRLNRNAVFVDLWALRAIADAGDGPPEWRCERALALYAGPLLGGEAEGASECIAVATARDLFVRVFEQSLSRLPNKIATTLLSRAIESETGEERLYQFLIESLLKSLEIGRSQEVLRRSETAILAARGQPPSEHFRRRMAAAIADSQREQT